MPERHTVANELIIDLHCGSVEVAFDRIRIPSVSVAAGPEDSAAPLVPEGLYVLEVSDAVNAECVVAANQLTVPCASTALPCDVQRMTKVARSLPANTEVVVKVEAYVEQ